MITCEILTPNGPYKTFETESLLLGTIDGERGLLEHHMPIILMLDISKLVTIENGEKNYYAVSGGVCYFEKGHAKICVNGIENKKDIDLARANEAKQRALDRINNNRSDNSDLKRAQIALKKAINRINISNY